MRMRVSKLITIERHIAEEEHMLRGATGEFSRLMRDMLLAIRLISRDVRRAGLNDILGLTDGTNIHGEQVKKLDQIAHDTIFRAMDHGGHLCIMVSEESEELIKIPPEYSRGKYVLLFDPLDGSSNIDINVTIGTIFSIYHRVTPEYTGDGTLEDVLQPGSRQVAAGYVCYGSSTQLVYTTGNGVDVFTYDPTIGEFLLSDEKIQIPNRGKCYSINEGNASRWDDNLKRYIEYLKTPSADQCRPYSLRYVGTSIADVHRTIMYGGIFMYPADRSNPKGKLRLLYECNPLAMIVEQAGGRASNGVERTLNVRPDAVHGRSPLFIGSKGDVLEAEAFLRGDFPKEVAAQDVVQNLVQNVEQIAITDVPAQS
jgi:fructose-1,6-bisphosphatase I